jgi:hypothetical protein
MSIKPTEDAWTDYGSDFVLIAEGKSLAAGRSRSESQRAN